MSRLFASVYLDEDVDVLIATLLRSRGWTATDTHAAGRSGSSDEQQLAYAAAQNLVLVTHNRNDFVELAQRYLTDNTFHPGIIVAVRRPPYVLATRLTLLLDRITADEFQNQVFYC
ncbi:MAG TPA: DUF5615 family PIN-like protein [Phycisphaerae bacterium]|nr:DUF5615 family PIN-like protein [Phycisphaerae bacterium]